jgi:glycogen synthase
MTSAQAAAQSVTGLSSATGSEITRIVDYGGLGSVATRQDLAEAESLTSLRKISPGKE